MDPFLPEREEFQTDWASHCFLYFFRFGRKGSVSGREGGFDL
jgi:hypothetical protein